MTITEYNIPKEQKDFIDRIKQELKEYFVKNDRNKTEVEGNICIIADYPLLFNTLGRINLLVLISVTYGKGNWFKVRDKFLNTLAFGIRFMADYTQASYETQFAVSTGIDGAAGHNGSKNFCVQNGYVDDFSWKTTVPHFYFADNVARVVDHMYVVPTSYVYNSLLNGDGFSTPASDKTLYKIVATGYDANEQATGTAEFVLCNGKDNIVSEWTKFDLSGLGKVVKITFNLVGSADLIGDYGLNCPAYFAYDDVAVRF